MPLGHRDEAYIPEPAGTTFVLTDAAGKDVACFVTAGALAAAARECALGTSDQGEIFLALRSAIIACASDKYDFGGAPGGLVVVDVVDLLQPEVIETGT